MKTVHPSICDSCILVQALRESLKDTRRTIKIQKAIIEKLTSKKNFRERTALHLQGASLN